MVGFSVSALPKGNYNNAKLSVVSLMLFELEFEVDVPRHSYNPPGSLAEEILLA